MEVGLRVVRGKDWRWGDQDGGEGGVGTVAEVGGRGGKIPHGVVVVIWDKGVKANYRAGFQSGDDLKVLDNAAAGVKHFTVTCDLCRVSGITGTRWNCNVCHDFDLCHSCYMSDKHDLSHTFTRYDTYLSYGEKVPARKGSRKVSSKGIYPGARVVRGINWNYKDQDGGVNKEGVVQSIGESSTGDSWRSWIKIKWDVGGNNDYRRGHQGNVDVKYVKPASGETYYADHLVTLGSYSSNAISNGDSVKVNASQLSAEEKSNYQPILGRIGKVIVETVTQKVLVKFPGQDSALRLPTSYLMKTERLRKGDVVMIDSDLQKVQSLQKGHGGWNDQMKSCVGGEAEVLGLDSDGDVRILADGKKWIVNPECCKLLTRGTGGNEEEEEEDDDDDNKADDDDDDDNDDDATTNLGAAFLHLLIQEMLNASGGKDLRPEHLVKMAAEGNLNAVKKIIQNYPSQVDFKVQDMTALQVAAHQGHLQVVIALANAGARLDARDSNGDNVLHFATIGNQPEVLEVLLKHRKNLVDVRNNDQRTCLHLAVIKQFPKCLQLLINYSADVNVQDKSGESALHMAVEKSDVDIQNQLINHSKTDFRLKNGQGLNSIHLAALRNNANVLKKLVEKAPSLVNVAKSDGFTALHIAALNGFTNAAEVLIKIGKANLNVKNTHGLTPLLLAVNQGRASMIELLVKNGADVNAEDKDGDTALHLAISTLSPKTPTAGGLFQLAILNVLLADKKPKNLDQAPAISKICSELPPGIQQQRAWVAICCYLLQNGADIDKQNYGGKAVGDIITDDFKQVLKKYIKRPVRQQSAEKQATARTTAAAPAAASSPDSASKCMMCLQADIEMIFYPCGHKVACSQCSARMKQCFSCHQKIQEKVKTEVFQRPKAARSPRDLEDPTRSNNSPQQGGSRRVMTKGDSVNCPLCEENVRNVVFLCGHSCCKDCADPLVDCHVCMQPIATKLTLM